MRKTITLLLCISAFTFNACQKKTETPTTQKPVVKIGAILPLSGDIAFLGEAMRDGILMAEENLDETKFHYQIIFEDDQMNPQKTITALRKLIHAEQVNAVVSVGAGPGNVVSPITEKQKIIHFSVAIDPKIAEGKFNFTHWTPASKEATLLVDLLKKRA